MKTLREQALEEIERALREELPDTRCLGELAANLHAIALQYDLRIDEELIVWIHYRAPGKSWTSAEFRRWCQRFVEAREELKRLNDDEDLQKLCPQCLDRFAQRTHDGRWWCSDCGVVN
jgi:ribosomal protein S27AE